MANGPSDTTTTPRSGRTPPPEHRVQIKNADAIQEQLLEGVHWLEDHSRLVIAIIVVAVIGGIAYAAWQGVSKHQERVAQEAYYKVEAPFMKKRDAFEKTKFKAFMPPDQVDKTPGEVPTGDIAKDYGVLITNLEDVAKEYEGTAASGQAAILAAETYLDYKNPDKAAEMAQIPALKLPANHTLAILGKIMWGNALSVKGDCQAALGVWQQVLDTKSADYLAPDVNLRMGTCLQKLGQNDRASEAYRNAAKNGDSAAAQTAKGLLRSLELKSPAVATTAPEAAAAAALRKK